jgi:hypothetical protein
LESSDFIVFLLFIPFTLKFQIGIDHYSLLHYFYLFEKTGYYRRFRSKAALAEFIADSSINELSRRKQRGISLGLSRFLPSKATGH